MTAASLEGFKMGVDKLMENRAIAMMDIQFLQCQAQYGFFKSISRKHWWEDAVAATLLVDFLEAAGWPLFEQNAGLDGPVGGDRTFI